MSERCQQATCGHANCSTEMNSVAPFDYLRATTEHESMKPITQIDESHSRVGQTLARLPA